MCMYDGCENEAKFYRHSVHVARKDHKCVECGRVILRGEQYHYDFQVYDTWPSSSYHTCLHCRVAQQWLIRECGGYLIEGTWEDIREHIQEYPALRFPLGRLVVGARHKWAGMPVPPVPVASAEDYVR